MSTRELQRAGILARVKAETLSLASAARMMAVSSRQAKRLYRRYREEGAAGVRHRSAGRPSNRTPAVAVRDAVLALVRAKYSGAVDERFGPTLAAEHLASEDGITVDHETLRRWMLGAGLWSRARKRSPHRRRRTRKAHFGELVQLDGSFHDWFEARGPHSCLVSLVDDATGRTLGGFSPQETIGAAVTVLRAWIERYGIPQALYTDWKNVYVRLPTEEERLTGAVPLTQLGRMCAQLGIRIIPASSPQAKGRSERNHGTHQDRLVKKRRRKAVADLAAANAFLEAAYWTEHNRRFTRPPTAADDFHVAVPRGLRLDQVFRLEATRTLSNDWVVRYDNRFCQRERQSPYPPARGSVVVRQAMNGQIEIRYRDRLLRATEITGSPGAAAPAPAPAPGTPKRASVTHGWPRRPSGDHPWRHDALSEVPIWQVADR
jgi:transposase